ncbi:hypothetical protein SESBI_38910 [Sesbania bispinosa]|nr:hypothetical protein SESBI_38910 [Sesbania bispinosa]
MVDSPSEGVTAETTTQVSQGAHLQAHLVEKVAVKFQTATGMGLDREMVSYKDICLGVNVHNVSEEDMEFMEETNHNGDSNNEEQGRNDEFLGDPLCPIVRLTEEERVMIRTPWKRSILLGRRMSLRYFQARLYKLWQPRGELDASMVDRRDTLVPSEGDSFGPWMIVQKNQRHNSRTTSGKVGGKGRAAGLEGINGDNVGVLKQTSGGIKRIGKAALNLGSNNEKPIIGATVSGSVNRKGKRTNLVGESSRAHEISKGDLNVPKVIRPSSPTSHVGETLTRKESDSPSTVGHVTRQIGPGKHLKSKTGLNLKSQVKPPDLALGHVGHQHALVGQETVNETVPMAELDKGTALFESTVVQQSS